MISRITIFQIMISKTQAVPFFYFSSGKSYDHCPTAVMSCSEISAIPKICSWQLPRSDSSKRN